MPPTQISMNPPATRPHPQGKTPTTGNTTEEPKDNFREVVETIVFVVVLVLLLKTFLAEAFVIPTGSMATTLLGYHYQVTCEKCKYPFPVNASHEADPQEGPPQPVYSCTCPNCGYTNVLQPRLGEIEKGRAP
jgi:signal peptidase I